MKLNRALNIMRKEQETIYITTKIRQPRDKFTILNNLKNKYPKDLPQWVISYWEGCLDGLYKYYNSDYKLYYNRNIQESNLYSYKYIKYIIGEEISKVISNSVKEGLREKQIHKLVEKITPKKIKGKPISRNIQNYLYGISDAYISLVYRNNIEFCYWINKKRYSIRKDSPLHYRKHGIDVRQLTDKFNGFYYIHNGKPF